MVGFCEQGNESLRPLINRVTITTSTATVLRGGNWSSGWVVILSFRTVINIFCEFSSLRNGVAEFYCLRWCPDSNGIWLPTYRVTYLSVTRYSALSVTSQKIAKFLFILDSCPSLYSFRYVMNTGRLIDNSFRDVYWFVPLGQNCAVKHGFMYVISSLKSWKMHLIVNINFMIDL